MQVKCLSTREKKDIVNYHNARYFQKDIAKMYAVSARTINRVLNEAGVATAVPRLKGEAHRTMQILKKAGITVDQLEQMLLGPKKRAA